MRKTVFFTYAKTKTHISCTLTAQLISAFVFTIRIVRSLYYINPKFQASSHLLWLYRPVGAGYSRKPEDRFSHNEVHVSTIKYILFTYVFLYRQQFDARIRTAFLNGISDQN